MKPYENSQYINDIYELAKMEFTTESVMKAGEICRRLSRPMSHWQFRTMDRCFFLGMALMFGWVCYTIGSVVA